MPDKKDASKKDPAKTPQPTDPSIQVIAQFVKDLSFENPHAPESLVAGWPAPETAVQIQMNNRNIKDNLHECLLSFRIEAKNKKDNRMAFIMEVSYGALVALHNIPKENVLPVMMVEVPKLLFPFVREIVANTTSRGGYPPLYLTPVSFEAIYMDQMKRAQAESEKKKAEAGKK